MEAGMNYQEARDEAQLRVLLDEKSIDPFFKGLTEKRQSIIFFPGGMASRLFRAKSPYKANSPPPQLSDFKNQEVWLSLWTFGHPQLNALKLKLHKEADGFYHDEDDRIIIADGCIGLKEITPYDDFSDWCKANNINLFIFGWDWRRPLDDTVTFFLNKFLPRLNELLGNAIGPLKNFTLVGHSFGGMIVKLILRRGGDQLDRMNRAITVATPFYGTGGQIHRWFEGEPLLNHLGEDKIDIIKTLGSLPSGYTLNWLGQDTFNAIREKLQSDDDFKVEIYPSKEQADPYNPIDRDGRVRYSTGRLSFSLKELDNGRRVCQDLVGGLPDEELAKKYFNIRGVQALGPNAPPLQQTICGTTWELINPDFDPRRDKSPITSELGAGDQVLAAWSTHDVTCPHDNRITVKGILHHSFILSSDEVQQKLGELMGLPPSSIKKVNSVPETEIKSLDQELDADAERFVQGLHDLFQDPKSNFEKMTDRLKDGAEGVVSFLRDPRQAVQPDKILNNVLGAVAATRGFSNDQLPSIIRRIIMRLCTPTPPIRP
jgi:hypothetical protein